MLARNPEFADLLLGKVVGGLTPLDLPEVELLRRERLAAAVSVPSSKVVGTRGVDEHSTPQAKQDTQRHPGRRFGDAPGHRGTAIGNFMEWYDFGVYGYIATTIAQVFYPGNSVSAVHLIATFSTLAAAYVVRPLGGFVLGPLGDRIGRKRVLVITILMMTVGTTMTGLLPGYSTIGIWAPILLLVARIFQGLSTGGEFVGAMTYLVEQAPDQKRGMMVGFLPLGNLVGFVLAGLLVTALQAWLPSRDMLAWGWRIPLLLAAPFGVLALYLRLRIKESPAYKQVSSSGIRRSIAAGSNFGARWWSNGSRW